MEIDGQLEEYYYLELGQNLSIKTFKNLLKDLEEKRLDFSEQGCSVVANIVLRFLSTLPSSSSSSGNPSSLTKKSLSVVQCLTRMLYLEPNMQAFFTKGGPSLLLPVPLRLFLLHPPAAEGQPNPFVDAGLSLVRALVELCPGFSDWKSFVRSDSKGGLAALLDPFVANLNPAKGNAPAGAGNREGAGEEEAGEGEETRKKKEREREDGEAASMGAHYASSHGEDETMLARVLQHIREQREEMLDDGEAKILRSIRMTTRRLKNLINGDPSSLSSTFLQLRDSLNALVEVQTERRKRKAQRFFERRQYIEDLSNQPGKGNEEPLKTYRSNLDAQEKAINCLESLYQDLTKVIGMANVTSELCFLDQQISSLYEVSISIVVAGVVKVGKSTVVNSLIGRNLSPRRDSVMTSIPTRFVHDSSCEKPMMVVPFASELNVVVDRIKALLNEGTMEEASDLFAREHSSLLMKIRGGLRFIETYQGIDAIMQISTSIHDVFRLAVNDLVSPMLAPDLPLDWSQSLDHYLTVYLKFPDLELATGLLTLSLIDTPGINEAEVKKLNLHNTVKDVLNVSTLGVLVVPNDGTIFSKSYDPLIELFGEARKRYNLPMMVMATRTDTPKAHPDLTREKEISQAFKNEEGEKLFAPEEVFLVSGLKMLLSEEMLRFMEREKRKPNPESTDPAEAQLVEDFFVVSGFSMREDAVEYFEDVSIEKLKEKCRRLKQTSNFPTAHSHITQTAIGKGVPTLIQTALFKVHERIEGFLSQLQSQSPTQALLDTRKVCSNESQILTDMIGTIKKELVALKEKVRRDLLVKEQQIKDYLLELPKRPVSSSTEPDTFEHVLLQHLNTLPENRSLLLKGTKSISFESDKAAKDAMSDLSRQVKRAIEAYLSGICSSVPQNLQKFIEQNKRRINERLAVIRNLFKTSHGIKLPLHFAVAFENLFEEDISPTFSRYAQSIVQKNNRLAVLMTGVASFFKIKYNLEPSSVRKLLSQQALPTLESANELINAHLDRVFGEIQRTFAAEVNQEIRSINEIIDAKIAEMTIADHLAQVERVQKEEAQVKAQKAISKNLDGLKALSLPA